VSAATAGHAGQLEKHPGGTISGNGVTLDHKDFTSPVVVTGDNVTIRNSRFSLAAYNVLQVGKGRNTVVENNTFNGGNRSLDSIGILVQGANAVTIRGNDISQHANGIRLMGSATIVENYIHDLIAEGGGPHRDNIEIYGGAKNSTITHNRIVHENGETSPLNFASWGAPIDNIRVEKNFVDGGNCTITYDPYGHSHPTRVQFVGNVFGDNSWYKGCLFNFVGTSALPVVAGTADASTHAANPRRYLWQNNTWGETGTSSKDATTIGVPTR
jgi:parallel beta-helix repeat protein